MRRLLGWLVVLGLLVAATAGVFGWRHWQRLHEPYAGWSGDAAEVAVAPGTSAGAILARLEAEGVLADAELARLYLVHKLGDPPLHAGDYRFDEPLDVPSVLERLIEGDVVTDPVTIIEGLTLRETAQAIAGAGFSSLDALLEAMSDPAPIADLDPAAENLEGYLYPDTYTFPRGTDARAIVDKLVQTFRRRWEREVAPIVGERRTDSAERQDEGSSIRDLVILASIVEKESQLDEERAVVASVYANRLRIGMGLYADPTVIYGLKLQGTWDGNLRRTDLQADDPYNTYVHAGLPPGPICSPSVASLLAAAAPAETPYLYFVSRNDGSHVFARTLEEHNRNVDRWQKRYWRERWARERAERRAAEHQTAEGGAAE